MTSKTKRWIPPVIPLRNDLVVWKALFNDLHDNLIDAGLVQTDDTGQLDIDGVSALPADGNFAGYRIYRFDDALAIESPVYIKLRFGCDAEGTDSSANQRRSRTPRIHCTVSNVVSDGNGELSGETVAYGSPQSFSGSGTVTSNNEHYGTSYYCRNDDSGFFGFFYGVGSRNKPPAANRGNYHGATFSLVIQRSTDAVGNPTPDGIMVMGPGIDSASGTSEVWVNGVIEPAKTQYLSGGTTVPMTRLGAVRVAGDESSVIDSDIYLQPVFTPTPTLKQWTTLVTYRTQDIAEGTEFTLEVVPGQPRNFIALGNETSMSVDPVVGQRAAFAMLFE